MSDPCFPVLDSEVCTEAPSSYLNQVLKFEKGKTKNLVLELGSDYQSLMSVGCCSPQTVGSESCCLSWTKLSSGQRVCITRLFLQPSSALCFFIPKTLFTFKKIGARK